MDRLSSTDSEEGLLRSTNGSSSQPPQTLEDPSCMQIPHLPYWRGTLVARIRSFFDWTEMKMQIRLAAPMIFVNLFYYLVLVISVMFVGHLGELELASASLACSIANVTGTSVVIGMAGALETLCGQAFGAKQYRRVGQYLQQGIVILVATATVLSFLWANIEKLLLALGQDSQISSGAGGFVRFLIPALFAYATSQPLQKFLQSQSLVNPLVWIGLAAVVCHVPICWLLVFKAGMGVEGGALASSISYWINTLLLAAYVQFSPACSQTRAPISRKAFHDMMNFCKLAFQSGAMTCLEWWAYEILVIVSGLLPDPELQTSTLAVCVTTSMIFFMVPLGLCAASSTRVSNELGAARPAAASTAVRVGTSLALITALVMSTLLLLIRNVWVRAFSSDEDVINSVSTMIPFLALANILDSLQAVLAGILRGAGWQKSGAYTNLGAYYVLGLPVAILLGFVTGLSCKGLILGILCGSLGRVVSFSVITWMADWDAEVKRASTNLNFYFDAASEPLLSDSKEGKEAC